MPHIFRATGLALLLAIIGPRAIHAQAVAVGSRVRVSAPQASLENQVGELLWLDSDSLVVEAERAESDATGASPTRWVVPLGLLSELEVSQGVRSNPDGGFLIGAAIGFGAGAIIFGPYCFEEYYRDICAVGLGSTTAGFSFLGFLFGGLSRTERWIAVDRPM